MEARRRSYPDLVYKEVQQAGNMNATTMNNATLMNVYKIDDKVRKGPPTSSRYCILLGKGP